MRTIVGASFGPASTTASRTSPDSTVRDSGPCVTSIVEVERKGGDDYVGARLQHRLEQPAPLVVQDLVAALAGQDLGNQHGDRRVLVFERFDVLEDAADQRALRIDQDLDRHAALPLAPVVLD